MSLALYLDKSEIPFEIDVYYTFNIGNLSIKSRLTKTGECIALFLSKEKYFVKTFSSQDIFIEFIKTLK